METAPYHIEEGYFCSLNCFYHYVEEEKAGRNPHDEVLKLLDGENMGDA